MYCLAGACCPVVKLIVVLFSVSSVCVFDAVKALWFHSSEECTTHVTCHVVGDAIYASGHVHSVGGRIIGD